MDIYIGLAAQLIVQVVILSFFYGKLSQRTRDVEGRVARIEQFIDHIVRRTIRVDFAKEREEQER